MFKFEFNNRNVITKIKVSPHKFAINTTKLHYLQEDIKISKNCWKKDIENEIYIIFSCNNYDNTRFEIPELRNRVTKPCYAE